MRCMVRGPHTLTEEEEKARAKSDQPGFSKLKTVTFLVGALVFSFTVLDGIGNLIKLAGVARWIRNHWHEFAHQLAAHISEYLPITLLEEDAATFIAIISIFFMMFSSVRWTKLPPSRKMTDSRQAPVFIIAFSLVFFILWAQNPSYLFDPNVFELSIGDRFQRGTAKLVTWYALALTLATIPIMYAFWWLAVRTNIGPSNALKRIGVSMIFAGFFAASGWIQDSLFAADEFLEQVSQPPTQAPEE
jgi:hypothetical protein